jgi:hypothetical protein
MLLPCSGHTHVNARPTWDGSGMVCITVAQDSGWQAHLTSPAMSTISRNAGTSLFGLYASQSHLKRSSGTFTRA